MKRRAIRELVILGVLSAAGMAAASAVLAQSSTESAPAVPAEELSVETSEIVGGMVVYIDPATGAILSEPVPGTVPLRVTPEMREALSTSSVGLVEVPLPGGGFKLDLQGRFQSPLIATIDANGTAHVQHIDVLPPPSTMP